MRCVQGEPVVCSSAQAADGTVTLCQAGFCVDVPVFMDVSLYEQTGVDDDDESSGWIVWVSFPLAFDAIALFVVAALLVVLIGIVVRFIYGLLYPSTDSYVYVANRSLNDDGDNLFGPDSLYDENAPL